MYNIRIGRGSCVTSWLDPFQSCGLGEDDHLTLHSFVVVRLSVHVHFNMGFRLEIDEFPIIVRRSAP